MSRRTHKPRAKHTKRVRPAKRKNGILDLFRGRKVKGRSGYGYSTAAGMRAARESTESKAESRQVAPRPRAAASTTQASGVAKEIESSLRNLGYTAKSARDTAAAAMRKAGRDASFDQVFRAAMQKNPRAGDYKGKAQTRSDLARFLKQHPKATRAAIMAQLAGYVRAANNPKRRRRPQPRKRKSTPARGRTAVHKNPEASGEQLAASRMYQRFHGRASKGYHEYVRSQKHPKDLAQLGRLVKLITEGPVVYDFIVNSPQVCCDAAGEQLYFIGGDQDVSAVLRKVAPDASKQFVDLGECRQIEYITRKKFDNFEEVTYYHKMGEESGERPRLVFDRLNKLLFFTGGAYKVKPEGIVN